MEESAPREPVRAFVRIKPHHPNEHIAGEAIPADVCDEISRRSPFDGVFGSCTGQDEIYDTCVRPLVQSLATGKCSTVVACGESRSGKTSLLELVAADSPNEGFIPRAIRDVFHELNEAGGWDETTTTVLVSYVEIYLEGLTDLLLPAAERRPQELVIKERPPGYHYVHGLTWRQILSPQAGIELFVEAKREFMYLGHAKGRSQRMFSISVQDSSRVSPATLSFVRHVDTPPPPRPAYAHARLFEEPRRASYASQYFDQVVCELHRSLVQNIPTRFIPYRNCKLTRLLANAFDGRASLHMIFNIIPSNEEATESTLQFATKVQEIGAAVAMAAMDCGLK